MSSQDDSDEMNLQPASEPDVPAERPTETPAKRSATGGHPGFFARAGQFIRDVRSEMKRVSWPTGEDVRNTTIIVLVNVVFFAVFLFLVDLGWGYTIRGFDWLVNKVFGA
jgi:preprotein translocase subunit SecE